MNRKNDGFGTVKPLPGQAGYKQNETDFLEREAKEMEVRLQMLQSRMQQQNLDDAALAKTGGSRWKSARTDKGSVTSYAKDVQERIKKRSSVVSSSSDHNLNSTSNTVDSISFAKATASARRQLRQQSGAETDFRSKLIDDWTVADVRDWLHAVLLTQYAPLFESNEINGPILLEISLEDLDYMGMTILGHRKVLLKGIEDLRKNRRVTINLAAAGPSGPSSGEQGKLTSQSLESLKDPLLRGSASVAKAEQPPAMHWSQLEPLSNNKVQVPPHHLHANLADGDALDEAAEQAAFSEAVLEWRKGGGGRVKIEREGEFKDSSSMVGKSLSSSLSLGAGSWNPMGSVESAVDFKEADTFGPIKMGSAAHIEPKGSAKLYQPATSSSSYLLQGGVIDEAAEREEFRRAVEEWRGGSKVKVDTSGSQGQSQSPRAAGGMSGVALAQRLAKELEQEQAVTQRALQMQRDEATIRLHAANQDLMEARRVRLEKDSKAVEAIHDEDELYSYAQAPSRHVLSRVSTVDSEDIAITPPLSPHDSDIEDAEPACKAESSRYSAGHKAEAKVSLTLMESSLGSVDFDADAKGGEYEVEEPDD